MSSSLGKVKLPSTSAKCSPSTIIAEDAGDSVACKDISSSDTLSVHAYSVSSNLTAVRQNVAEDCVTTSKQAASEESELKTQGQQETCSNGRPELGTRSAPAVCLLTCSKSRYLVHSGLLLTSSRCEPPRWAAASGMALLASPGASSWPCSKCAMIRFINCDQMRTGAPQHSG